MTKPIKPWQDRVKPGAFTGVKMEAMLAEIAESRAALAAKAKPMTDEEISRMAHVEDEGDWNELIYRDIWHEGFTRGVKAAEDHHDIKEKS